MSIGIPEALILLVIVLLFFGAGKVPQLMGDLAKGIKTFKAGMKEGADEAKPTTTPPAERLITSEGVAVDGSRRDEAARG
jgi:sec-independent protein translocase protein TatA